MLKDNLKTLRKQKGLSQEELSVKLNVVRQTISKWEQGLSVPDAEMLVAISKEFDTPVSTLLGEEITGKKPDTLKEISEKLEVVNLQLIERNERRRKIWHWIFIVLALVMILSFIWIVTFGNAYLEWDYNDPEKAILGVSIHAFVWVFIRIAPLILGGLIVGIVMTRKK